MKSIITLIAAIALLAGCAGIDRTDCAETAQRYQALLAQLDAGNVISPEDADRGRLWAQILETQCGWVRTRAARQGVPVVVQP